MAEVENKINIGLFDQVIELKEQIITKGTKAQTQKSFETKETVYGEVKVLPIAEAVINENSIMIQRITVTTYINSDVTNRWRLVWNADTYDIVNVIPVTGSTYMILEAIKVISNG